MTADNWPEIARYEGVDTSGKPHTIIVLGEPGKWVKTLGGTQFIKGYHRAYKTATGLYLNPTKPAEPSDPYCDEFAVLDSKEIIRKV